MYVDLESTFDLCLRTYFFLSTLTLKKTLQ